MLDLKKTYVVDEQNRRIAVQIDIETFERIEEALETLETLENYGLTQIIKANSREETVNLADAQSFYKTLEKAD